MKIRLLSLNFTMSDFSQQLHDDNSMQKKEPIRRSKDNSARTASTQEARRKARLLAQKESRSQQLQSRRGMISSVSKREEEEVYGGNDGYGEERNYEYGTEMQNENKKIEINDNEKTNFNQNYNYNYNYNRNDRKEKYQVEVCIPEKMQSIPLDLQDSWYCKALPFGKQVVIKTASNSNHKRGSYRYKMKTNVFCAKTGIILHTFDSNLPANTILEAILSINIHVDEAVDDTDVDIDAGTDNNDNGNDNDDSGMQEVKNPNSNTYTYNMSYNRVHVIDVMCYNGQWMDDTSLELREFWLHNKFQEDEISALETQTQKIGGEQVFWSISLVDTVDLSYDSLLALYEDILTKKQMQMQYEQVYYIRNDGLLFQHKESSYDIGKSPLVLLFKDDVTSTLSLEAETEIEETDEMVYAHEVELCDDAEYENPVLFTDILDSLRNESEK